MKLTTTYIRSVLFGIALTTTTMSFGQNKIENEEKSYIQVIGSAEKEIVPDEIYINIIIREKYVNKEKLTIESQEENLKSNLKEIGVDLNNIFLSDANADYVRVNWRKQDVLTKKNFTLKVSDATSVGQVFLQLEKLDITDAYISKVNHTKLDSFKKEMKILAIKAAKNKADYLLTAIGEQTGKILIVQELENGIKPEAGITIGGSRSEGTEYIIDGIQVRGKAQAEELQFKKIKIQAFINVKFGIK